MMKTTKRLKNVVTDTILEGVPEAMMSYLVEKNPNLQIIEIEYPKSIFEFIDVDGNSIFVELYIDDVQQYLLDNPHLKKPFSAPRIIDPHKIFGMKKDDGWKEVLKKVKNRHKKGTVET